MSIDETRCFPISATSSEDNLSTPLSPRDLLEQCEHLLQRCTDRSSHRGSLYCGGLGPFVFLRVELAKHFKESTKKSLALLEQAKQAAESVLEQTGDLSRVSLLESHHIGALCMLAAIEKRILPWNHLGPSTAIAFSSWMVLADQTVEELSRRCARLPPEQCEVLYGRAGALAAVFFLRKELDVPLLGNKFVVQIAIEILQQGLREARAVERTKIVGRLPLLWQWHGKYYLGAAHGVVGILHTLLNIRSTEWDQIEATMPSIRSTIKDTIITIASFCHCSGNLTSSLSEHPASTRKDRLVQWCHGAPGHCLLLIKASDVFQDPLLLSAAEDIAEAVIWPRGLLCKGVGLCHGISGNGYVMLCLSETLSGSRSLKWRGRALQYAHFALQHMSEIENTPDRPYSLFGGVGGLCAFLLACVSSLEEPTKRIAPKFPLYDF